MKNDKEYNQNVKVNRQKIQYDILSLCRVTNRYIKKNIKENELK